VFISETTEQIRARAMLSTLIITFSHACGRLRRQVSREIRAFAVQFPWLADQIPDDVWNAVYRVRAAGTVAP
jgi:hypothetical protein